MKIFIAFRENAYPMQLKPLINPAKARRYAFAMRWVCVRIADKLKPLSALILLTNTLTPLRYKV